MTIANLQKYEQTGATYGSTYTTIQTEAWKRHWINPTDKVEAKETKSYPNKKDTDDVIPISDRVNGLYVKTGTQRYGCCGYDITAHFSDGTQKVIMSQTNAKSYSKGASGHGTWEQTKKFSDVMTAEQINKLSSITIAATIWGYGTQDGGTIRVDTLGYTSTPTYSWVNR